MNTDLEKKNFIKKILDFLFSLPFLKKKNKAKESKQQQPDDIYPMW